MHIVKEPGKRHGHWRLTPKGEIRYDRAAQRRSVVAVPETPAAPAKVQRPPYPKDLAAEFTRILGADDEKLVGAVYRNGEVHWADAMQFPQTLRTKQNPPQPDPEYAALQRAMGLLALYARYTLGDQLQGTRAMPVEAIRRIAAVYPNASDAMKPIERLRHPNTDFADVAEILEGVKGRDKLARVLIPILYPLDAMPKREPIPVKPNALAGRDYPHEPGLDRLAERLATIRGVRPNEIDGMVREARAQAVLTISKPFTSRANAVIDRWVELGYAPGAPGADLQAAADEWVAAHRDAAVPYGKEATEAARATIAAAHDAYRASGATTFGAWVTSLPHLPFGPDQATVTRETEARAKKGLGLIPAVHPSLHDRIKGQRVNIVGASHPAADYASRATYFKGDAQAARENKGYPASPHIVVFPESSPEVVAHEYGHHLGAALGVLPILRAWVLSRATGAPKKLGPPYDSTELAYPDTFAHRYVGATTISGRHFSENANTEVLSMGVQYLAIDPDRFYQMDPDHALLTVGLLQGMNPAAPQAKPLGKSQDPAALGTPQPRNWPGKAKYLPISPDGYGSEVSRVLDSPNHRVRYRGSNRYGKGKVEHVFDIMPGQLDPARHLPLKYGGWYDKEIADAPGGDENNIVGKNGWTMHDEFAPSDHQEGDLYRGIGLGGYQALLRDGAIRTSGKGADAADTGGATYYSSEHHGAMGYATQPTDPLSAAQFHRPRYLLHVRPPEGTEVAQHAVNGMISSVKDDLPLSAIHAVHEVRPAMMRPGRFVLREWPHAAGPRYKVHEFRDLDGIPAVGPATTPPSATVQKSDGAPPRNWPDDLPWRGLGGGWPSEDVRQLLESPHHKVEYRGTEDSWDGTPRHKFKVTPILDPAHHKPWIRDEDDDPADPERWYDTRMTDDPVPHPKGLYHTWPLRDGWARHDQWEPQEHQDGDLWRGVGHGGYRAAVAAGELASDHQGDDYLGAGKDATYYGTHPRAAVSYAVEPTSAGREALPTRPRYMLHIRPPKGAQIVHPPDGDGYAYARQPLPLSSVVGVHEVRPYLIGSGSFTLKHGANGNYEATDFDRPKGTMALKTTGTPVATSPLAKGWYGEKEDEAPRNWPGDLPWKPLSPRGYAGNDIMRSLNSPHHRVEYVGSRETLQGATAHQFRVLPGVIDPARHKEFKHEPGRFYDSKISTDPGDGIFPNHKPRGGWQALEDFDPQGHEQGDLWRGIGHGGYQAFRADGMLATSHKGGDRYDSGGATYYGTTPGEAASYASNPTDFLAHAQFHRPRYLLHIRPPEGADVRYHAAGSVATLGTPIPESAVKATYEVRPYAMRSGNFTLHEEPDGTYHPADYNEPTVQNAIKKVATPKVKPLGKSAGEDDPAAEPPPNQWPAEVPWKGIHWGGHRDAAINYLNSPHWQVRHRGTRETAEGVKEHVFDIMPGHLDPERHIPLDPSKRMWYDREIAQPGGGHAGGYAVSPANGWELTSRFAPTDHRDGDLWRGIGYNGHKALMASGALQTSSKGADQYGAGKGQTYYGTDHDAAMYYAEYPTDALNQPQFHRPRYLLHVRPPQGTQATIQDKKYAIATVGDQMPLSAIHSTYELRPYALSAGSLTMRETPEGPYRATEYRPPESYVAIKKVGGAAPGGLAKSFQAPPAPSMDLPIDGDHPNWPTGLPKTVRLDPGYSIVANHMKTGTTRLSATDATQENEEYYGKGHRWRVTVDPHLDPALHGVVPGREPDSADPYVAGRAQWYDRELAEAKPDDDWNSMGLDQRHKVVPTVGKAEGWHDEIPAEKEDGYIYRGMSAGELRAAATNGGFASRGEHNIGDVQKGLTYFADDPKDAGSYATSFAPSGYKPTFGHPGYVVKLKNPGGDREVRLPHIPGEVGIRGAIPHHQIEQVYEARPYAVERGQSEIVSDGRTKDPIHQDGSGRGASSRVLWRTAHPSEFFGGPQPIQKSDAPATPWRYEEADPKRQPHRELRQHIDAALRYAHENYADMTGLRIKRGTDSPTAIMSTAQGRDGASLAYNPALTRNMATLRGHLATASQQEHHHALTPEGVAWHEVGHLVRNAHPEGYRVAGRIHSGVIDRLEDGRLSEARGHAVLGKYALHSNAETFSELYRLHHTTGLPADFAWAGPHIDSLRRGAPAVQKSGGPTITHHEDEFGSYRKVDGATDINGNWKRLERLHDDDEVLLHHATKTEHAQSILRDGWKANSGATNYTNSSPQHVYMGDRRSLGTYVGQKGGNHPALLAVAVKKRDLEPDLGSDWNAHARTNKRDLKARGIDAKNPTAIHTYAEINQVRAPHQTVRPLGYQDYHSGEEFWHQKPIQKSDGPETFAQFQAKPLVHTVGENHDGVFFHGTHKANVKTLAQPVPAKGFKREVSGRGLFGRGINEFGADVFLSDRERPHQALGFASGPGQALARVKLRDGSRILDLSDEATRTGIVNPGGPRVLRFFRRPAITDDLLAHVREHAPAVLRDHPAFERQMQAMDPAHPSFDPETWRSTLLPYARDRGYAAVRLADETLVPDRSAIEHVRHATPEERAALEAQHATYMGGPGFAKEPTGAYRTAWAARQGLAKSEVREPGKRGGKFWRDGKGHVRYGKQPGLRLGISKEALFGANQLTPKEDLKAIPAQVRAAIGHLYGDESGLGRNWAGDTYARVELADRNKTRLFEALASDLKRAGQHPDQPPSYADSAFRGMLDQVSLLYDPEEYRVNHTNPGESEMWTAPFQEKHDQLVAIVRRALYDDPAALVEAGKGLLASGRTPAEAAPGSEIAAHRERIRATVAAARDEFNAVGKGSPARWLALTRHDESDWADKWVKLSRMDEDDTDRINMGLAAIPLAKHYLVALEGSERPAVAWDHYNRSHYDPKQRMVKLDDDWSEDVVAHEYGHHLERQLGLGPLLTTWVRDRATGEQQPLGQPYRSGEQAYPDRFYNRYIGKVYGEVEGQPTTEALSMGIHALAVDPQAFYEADPEHFLLTMGLLQGLGGGGVAKSGDVKAPGSRGGKFWRDRRGAVRYGARPEPHAATPAQEAPQASLSAGPSYSVIQPQRNLAPPLPVEALSPKARKAIRAAYNDVKAVWTYPDYKNDTERKAKIAELVAACERDVLGHWQKHDPSDPNQALRLRHAETVVKHFTRYALGNNYKLTDGDVMDRARALAAAVVPEVFSPKGYAATAKRRDALLAQNPVAAHTGQGVRTPEAREILLSRLNAILPERQWDGNRAYLLVDDALKAWGQRIATGTGWRDAAWKAWHGQFVYTPRDKPGDAALSMARWQASDRDREPDAYEGERAEANLWGVLDGWADAMDAAADRHVAAHVANVHAVIERARQALEGEAKGDPARFVALHQPRSPKVTGQKAVEPSASTFAGKEALLADSIRAVGLIPMSPQVRAKALAYGKPPLRWVSQEEAGDTRSNYDGRINLIDEQYPQVAAHEYGHHIERALGAAPVLTRWIRHRAQGPAIHLGYGYKDGEKAYPDAFIGRYVGKEYGGAYTTTDGSVIDTQSSSTEVLSMGVEALITEPENFYKTDPDHYLLTMGVLLGHAEDLPYVPDETFEEERAIIRERAARFREYRARSVEKSGDVREPGKRGSTRWWRTPAGQVRYGERPSAPVGTVPMPDAEREGHTRDLIQPWNNLTPETPYAAIPPKVERAISRLFQAPTALTLSDPTMCRAFKNFAMQTLLRVAEPGGDRALDHSRQEFRRNIEITMRAFDPERWAKARPGWTQERAIQELCDLADTEVYDNLPALRKRIERARKPNQPRHSRPVSRDDRGLWDKLDEIAQRHLGLAGVTMNRENTDAFMACRMLATRGMNAWEDAERWPDQHAVDAATGAGYRALYADPEQHDARGEVLRLATGITKDQMMPILHAAYTEWAGWIDKGDKAIRDGQRKRRAALVAAARKRCEKETGGDLAAFVERYAIGEQVAYRQVGGSDPAESIETNEWPTLIAGVAAVPLGAPVLDLLQRRQRARVRRGDNPRSSYTPGGTPRLNMGAGFTADVAAHEFAHHVEQVCGWGAIVRPWVLDRAEGPAQHLGYGYEKDEEAYPDHFMNRYVGKEYGERHGSTEVIAVGVQALVLDPVAFEQADAEHCWLTLALLLGLGMDDVAKSFDPAGGHPDQRPPTHWRDAQARIASAGASPQGYPVVRESEQERPVTTDALAPEVSDALAKYYSPGRLSKEYDWSGTSRAERQEMADAEIARTKRAIMEQYHAPEGSPDGGSVADRLSSALTAKEEYRWRSPKRERDRAALAKLVEQHTLTPAGRAATRERADRVALGTAPSTRSTSGVDLAHAGRVLADRLANLPPGTVTPWTVKGATNAWFSRGSKGPAWREDLHGQPQKVRRGAGVDEGAALLRQHLDGWADEMEAAQQRHLDGWKDYHDTLVGRSRDRMRADGHEGNAGAWVASHQSPRIDGQDDPAAPLAEDRRAGRNGLLKQRGSDEVWSGETHLPHYRRALAAIGNIPLGATVREKLLADPVGVRTYGDDEAPPVDMSGRSDYIPGDGNRPPLIRFHPEAPDQVAAHEYGHHVENVLGAGHAMGQWIERRALGAAQHLGPNYPLSEKAYPDKFIHRYVGKVYPSFANSRPQTEAFSTGVEGLTTEPDRFHEADPEHFHLVMGHLLGLHHDLPQPEQQRISEGVAKSFDPAGGHPDQRPQASPEEAGANLASFMAGAHKIALNSDGTPRTFYHGTRANFDTFRPSESGSFGPGMYFTSHKGYANIFAGEDEGANVIPAHLAIRNPYITPKSLLSPAKVKQVFDKGHDAIVQRHPRWPDEMTLMVRHPHQIKSASGNSGHYDPTDPHLGKSEDVQHPGARGGRYWRDGKGHVRYGDQPGQQAEPNRVPAVFKRDNLQPAPPSGLVPPKLVEQMRQLAAFGPEGEKTARAIGGALADPNVPEDQWGQLAELWASGLRQHQERAIYPEDDTEEDREHRKALELTVRRGIVGLRKKFPLAVAQEKLADLQHKATPRAQFDHADADRLHGAIIAAARADFEEETAQGGNVFTWVEKYAMGEEEARRFLGFPEKLASRHETLYGLPAERHEAVVKAVAAIPVGAAVLERLHRAGEVCNVMWSGERSSYFHESRAIKLQDDTAPDVAAHEFGHFIERMLGWGATLHDWVTGRATGQQVPLGRGYNENEKAYPDTFIGRYVGKVYGDKYGMATEVLSVGIQATQISAGAFRATDRDHFFLVLGLLLGLGPDPRPTPR